MNKLPSAVAAVLLAGVLGACSAAPEDVLRNVGRRIVEGDARAIQALVSVDSVAASIASGNPLLIPMVTERLRTGLDENQVVAHALGAFLTVHDFDFDIGSLERAGTRIFRGLGPVQEQEDRALAPVTLAHPFNEAESVEVSVELARSAEGWRVVGLRGLSALTEILEQPSPVEWVREELQILASREEAHYADAVRYSSDAEEIGFQPREGVSVEIGTTGQGFIWWATAQWDDDPGYSCAVYNGRNAPPEYPTTNMGFEPPEPGEHFCDPYRALPYDYLR